MLDGTVCLQDCRPRGHTETRVALEVSTPELLRNETKITGVAWLTMLPSKKTILHPS